MTTQELEHIISQFDENELKKLGIFGILQYGGGSDESFIRANKEGLELMALQLLKASKETDSILEDKDKSIIPFDYEEKWVWDSSDTYIEYIEPIPEKQGVFVDRAPETTFFDSLIPFGCWLILVILGIAMLIGLGTLIGCFF